LLNDGGTTWRDGKWWQRMPTGAQSKPRIYGNVMWYLVLLYLLRKSITFREISIVPSTRRRDLFCRLLFLLQLWSPAGFIYQNSCKLTKVLWVNILNSWLNMCHNAETCAIMPNRSNTSVWIFHKIETC
jgi:hypothetical protein